jgi:hypothetical protein
MIGNDGNLAFQISQEFSDLILTTLLDILIN